VTEKPEAHPKTPLRKGFLRSFVRCLAIGVVLLWSFAALILLAARWIDPLSTAVHIQRQLQAWIHQTPYHERYKFIPLGQISPDLQHAVVAAEDARFYQHHGFDWHEIQIAAGDDLEGDRTRGASTIPNRIRGRHVTGYRLEGDRELQAMFGSEFLIPHFPPTVLEETGAFYSRAGRANDPCVVVDGKLVTGQNQQSASEYALALLHVMAGRTPVSGTQTA
jgi:hypothetical protein